MTLTRPLRAGYGVAEAGTTSVEVLIRVGLLIFYTEVVGLPPHLAGYAVAIGVLWDAVTDPLMGRISDHTRGRHGRRRPYILAGSLALAVSVVALFSPPDLATNAGRFAYLLGTYLLVNTAMTVISVPHAAFAGDLTRDPAERTELFGWRLLFGNLGLVLGTAVPGVLAAGATDAAGADRATAWTVAVATVLTALVTLAATRGRDPAHLPAPSATLPAGPGLLASLGEVAANRAFRPLFAAYFVANLGLTVNASLALYYYRHRLLLEEAEVRGIIAFFMLVFCLSIPGWVLAARRFGKKWPLVVGVAGLGAMSCVVYPLFPPGDLSGPLFAGLLGGLLVGSVVLLDATLADVVDYDRLRAGESRFGLYFGVWRMGGKMSRAVALVAVGNLLSLAGFEPGAAPSEEAAWHLALLFGPGVGGFLLLAATIAALHPLTEIRHRTVLRALERRARRTLQPAGERARSGGGTRRIPCATAPR